MRECLICKGVQYVITKRYQTGAEMVSGRYKAGEMVYGIRMCPCCLLAGVTIGAPDESKDLVGVVAEGWCDFAERQVRLGRIRPRLANLAQTD